MFLEVVIYNLFGHKFSTFHEKHKCISVWFIRTVDACLTTNTSAPNIPHSRSFRYTETEKLVDTP